jgi:hypothetical protein
MRVRRADHHGMHDLRKRKVVGVPALSGNETMILPAA